MPHFKAKMHEIPFRLGLRPRPRWESLQRSRTPRPPSWTWGPTTKGRGGRERKGLERKGRKGKGKERRAGGKGGEGREGEETGRSERRTPPTFLTD